MRPKKHETTGEEDLFRARLDQIIRMKHELVQLAGKLDWDWLYGEIAPLYSDKGRPGIETLDQPLRRCSQATNWGDDLGKRAISAAHQHSLPRHARRRQHWGRYKRYQLDAKRHRADTKGMYRDHTGCLHTSTQGLASTAGTTNARQGECPCQ
jgi:hypothetical protein